MYTVKQVSEIMEISPYTLRFYDKEGLFPELGRDELNRRVFTSDDLTRIQAVIELRKMGLPLMEIRQYMESLNDGEESLKERYNLIKRQKERVMEELGALKQQLQLLRTTSAQYESMMTSTDKDFMKMQVYATVAEKKSVVSQRAALHAVTAA